MELLPRHVLIAFLILRAPVCTETVIRELLYLVLVLMLRARTTGASGWLWLKGAPGRGRRVSIVSQ
jgi:hypothetical protein